MRMLTNVLKFFLLAFGPAVLVTVFTFQYLSLNWYWTIVAAMLPIAIGHGLLRCSMISALVGWGAFITASFFLEWSAIASVFANTVALFGGLFLWGVTQDWGYKYKDAAKEDAQASTQHCTREDKYKANPRCPSCKVEALCPYKPGAVFDRYKERKVA